MPKSDLLQLDGQVIDTSKGGMYKIKLDNEMEILAKLSGKMRQHRIRVVEGDRVRVGVSPYDVTHGLIMYRYK